MQGIYTKIDWYTAVINNQTIRDVFRFLDLDLDYYIDDLLRDCYQRSSGYDDPFIFHFEGVNIESKWIVPLHLELNDSIFDKMLPNIRLDISGSGLEYLRSIGKDIDRMLSDQERLLPEMHATRCDFAFDFVNYKADFLDQCISYINENHTADNRLILYKKVGNSLVYDIRTGQQKTLYIGSPRSDHLLRIYDKKMQYTDLGTGVYLKDNPYENPESWIRVELQTRKAAAQKLLYSLNGDLSFFDILKYIYERYSFADLSTPAHRRLPAQFWIDLFDWEKIPSLIVHNDYFVQFVPQSEKVVNTFKRDIQSIICAILVLAKDGRSMADVINDYLVYLQSPAQDPGVDVSRRRRYRNFILRLNQCGLGLDDFNSDWCSLKSVSGDLRWQK